MIFGDPSTSKNLKKRCTVVTFHSFRVFLVGFAQAAEKTFKQRPPGGQHEPQERSKRSQEHPRSAQERPESDFTGARKGKNSFHAHLFPNNASREAPGNDLRAMLEQFCCHFRLLYSFCCDVSLPFLRELSP